MSGGLETSVVFLVFNRPQLTARVFARIRDAQPARLFIVADGPRANRQGEAEKCREVRGLIEHSIDWPCEVSYDYADVNLGSALRVSTGITKALEQVDRVIVLEDDCLPDPSFFPFCSDLLERYSEESQIGQIAGCSFRLMQPTSGESYYFSRYPHCWGWATWRRAWQHYDHTMSSWADHTFRNRVLNGLGSRAEKKYWRHAFAGTLLGRHDTWDYRWTLTCWAHQWLSIVSTKNLVSNIGFGPEATHTKADHAFAAMPTEPVEFPLRHPKLIQRDIEADVATGVRCFIRPSLFSRISRRLKMSFS